MTFELRHVCVSIRLSFTDANRGACPEQTRRTRFYSRHFCARQASSLTDSRTLILSEADTCPPTRVRKFPSLPRRRPFEYSSGSGLSVCMTIQPCRQLYDSALMLCIRFDVSNCKYVVLRTDISIDFRLPLKIWTWDPEYVFAHKVGVNRYLIKIRSVKLYDS